MITGWIITSREVFFIPRRLVVYGSRCFEPTTSRKPGEGVRDVYDGRNGRAETRTRDLTDVNRDVSGVGRRHHGRGAGRVRDV